MRLATVLVIALTAPEELSGSAFASIAAALDTRAGRGDVPSAIAALAAVLYSRPDLGRGAHAARLARRLGSVPSQDAGAIADGLRLLASSPAAGSSADALLRALRRPDLGTRARLALLGTLRDVVQWRPELVDLADVLRFARGATRKERGFLLREIVERFIFAEPRRFEPAQVGDLVTVFRDGARLRYTVASLAARRHTRPATRARAARWLEGRHGPAVRTTGIRRDPFSVLVVHNIADGQGDEIVRVCPLVQALLDTNPALVATILTRRTYLYDHPRVIAASIHDDGAIGRSLRWTFDAVLNFYERAIVDLNYRPGIQRQVEQYLGQRRPFLVVEADKGHNHFVFHTVRLRGRSIAGRRGLDRRDAVNIYDGAARLLHQLRLRDRAGEETPAGGSLLVGNRSAQAEAAWQRLCGAGRRPVALVNVLGGRHPLKGFTRDDGPRVSAEVAGLIDEGFHVILLPNGEPWGRREAIVEMIRGLDHRRRARVAIGPDPRDGAESIGVALTERPALDRADRVMRLYKYFASYADLVVTVEGWMMHLAYALGRPFRMLLAAHSHSFDWHPRGRGGAQRLVAAMSPCAPPDVSGLLGPHDAPPRPGQPRKMMLLCALRGLGRVEAETAGPLLDKAMASPDSDVRAAALEVIAGLPPAEVRTRIESALDDESAQVRAIAARVLLGQGHDGDRSPGERARLEAHRAIARQDWKAVVALGPAALPALGVAARDRDDVIRREARQTTLRLIQRWLPSAPRVRA